MSFKMFPNAISVTEISEKEYFPMSICCSGDGGGVDGGDDDCDDGGDDDCDVNDDDANKSLLIDKLFIIL